MSATKDKIYSSIIAAWAAIEKKTEDYRKALNVIQDSIQRSDRTEEEKLMIYDEIEKAKVFWSKLLVVLYLRI